MLNMLKKKLKWILLKDTFESKFNVPVKFRNNDFFINERLIEIPFVHKSILGVPEGSSILDFGCTRSWLSLEFASLGYKVTGVDLRNYNYNHPNFQFKKGNLLDMELQNYDAIIALSVIEHIGIGAYGDQKSEQALIQVLDKIYEMLNPGGIFVFTLPAGKDSINNFERSFRPDELYEIFDKYNYEYVSEKYFHRNDGKYWQSCDAEYIINVRNDKDAIAKIGTGVNGCGCFVLRKVR